MNEAVARRTRETLGQVIRKPPLTDALLNKPPFRYLHDLIAEVIRVTGFLKGLYTDFELKSDNVKDKDSKINFLQKAIDVVVLVTGEPLAVKPVRVVAGHEPEKTNEFLQAIGKCCLNKLSSDAAVKRVLAGERADPKGKSPSSKPREKESRESKPEEPKTHRDKESKRDPEIKDRSSSRDSKAKEGREREKEGEKQKDNKERHKEPERETLREGEKRERERSKKTTKQGREAEKGKGKGDTGDDLEREKGQEREKKHEGGREKDRVKGRSKEKSRDREGEKDRERGRDWDKHRDKEKDEEHLSERGKEKAERKVRAMSLPRRTLPMLGLFQLLQPGLGTSMHGAATASLGTLCQGLLTLTGKDSFPISHLTLPFGSGKPFPLSCPSIPCPQSPSSSLGATLDPGRFPWDLLFSTPSSPSLRIPRPGSARPAPPRVKRQESSEPLLPERSGSAKTIPTVILDQQVPGEEDDEQFVVEAAGPLPQVIKVWAVPSNTEEYPGFPTGGLVKRILETKKDYEAAQKPSQPTDRKLVVSEGSRKRERDLVAKEIRKPQASIQTLCQNTLALGRIVDYIQEDMDAMKNELEMWRQENRQHEEALRREQSITDSVLEPLKAELAELDQLMNDQQDKIRAVKANILRNDEKIQRMVLSINQAARK
ncbi:MIPT3 protein, partial [Mionectes macconnelli]|nr:MIPT3 protein [Mionectes macconnelli]